MIDLKKMAEILREHSVTYPNGKKLIPVDVAIELLQGVLKSNS